MVVFGWRQVLGGSLITGGGKCPTFIEATPSPPVVLRVRPSPCGLRARDEPVMPEFHYFEFDLLWICCTTSCATNSQQVERSTGPPYSRTKIYAARMSRSSSSSSYRSMSAANARLTSAANPTAAAAAVDRRDRQTGGRFAAYCAERVTMEFEH